MTHFIKKYLILILLAAAPAHAAPKIEVVGKLRKIAQKLENSFKSESVRFESAAIQLFSPQQENDPSTQVISHSLENKRVNQIKLEILNYVLSRFESRYTDSSDATLFLRECLKDYLVALGSPDAQKSPDHQTTLEIMLSLGDKLKGDTETDIFERLDKALNASPDSVARKRVNRSAASIKTTR